MKQNNNLLLALNSFLLLSLLISINLLSQLTIAFFLISTFFYFKKKEKINIDIKKRKVEFIILLLPIIIVIITFFWSQNTKEALIQITKRLPLLIIPFGLYVQSFYVNHSSKQKNLYIYIIICTVYALYGIGILYIYYPISFQTNLTFIHLRHLISTNILHTHPVYIGLFSGLASILSFNFILVQKKLLIRTIFIICLFVNIFMLFFISARMSLGATLICMSWLLYSQKRYKLLIFQLIVFAGTIFIIQLKFPAFRFNEIIESISNYNWDDNNTLKIRKDIYTCVYSLFKESPLLGTGIGDLHERLLQCTKVYLGNNNYNSHNQYLEYLILAGLIGLLMFIFYLIYLFRNLRRSKNILGQCVFLFFIISFLTENLFARARGVFIFSFFIYFLYFFHEKTINNNQL
uniref:O-antigen ligase family protein n=1 Tax=Flavobacterium sp. TaxID=239 RepID=UPI00404A795D